jgi:putative oxidoreductase
MVSERGAVPGEAPVLLIARIALAAIFLYSGFGKLTGTAGFSTYLVNHGFPSGMTYALAILAGLTELLAGLALVVGWQARYAALVLALFTLVAALIGHRFWEIADAGQRMGQLIHFWKNIAMIGGFLTLYVAGPGPFSLDGRPHQENRLR